MPICTTAQWTTSYFIMTDGILGTARLSQRTKGWLLVDYNSWQHSVKHKDATSISLNNLKKKIAFVVPIMFEHKNVSPSGL